MTSLAALTASLAKKMEIAEILGWGLNNPDPVIFMRIQAGDIGQGCIDSRCPHGSHDPFTDHYTLIPYEGFELFSLGSVGFQSYFLVYKNSKELSFFKLTSLPDFHNWITEIQVDEITSYLLARLGKQAAV